MGREQLEGDHVKPDEIVRVSASVIVGLANICHFVDARIFDSFPYLGNIGTNPTFPW